MKTLLIISALLLSSSLMGQEHSQSRVRTENVDVRMLADSSVQFHMDLILPANLKLSSNRMMTFTPLLRNATGGEVALPSVYLYGRKRYILSKRKNRLPEGNVQLIRHNKGEQQDLDYTVTLPYKVWMDYSDVVLEENLCGCSNHQEENSLQPLAHITLTQPEVALPPVPAIACRRPQAEAVKRRTFEGQAFLDFPVDQTIIYPKYRKNPEELAKIDHTLDGFKPEDIMHVSIHGYASPEGSYSNNTRLAEGRAQALKTYILEKKHLSESIISVESTPEDWEGFKRLASQSDLTDKDQILDIANSDAQPDEKEKQLRKLYVSYLYMSKNWFPALRHSDYRIEYTVRPFTPEEARVMMKQDPTQLSLREMFDAAQLCEKGSDEYVHILETSARLYPDDPTANLNAAAMELERGNLSAARKYMAKADMNTQEAKDNMQRIILLEKKGKQ